MHLFPKMLCSAGLRLFECRLEDINDGEVAEWSKATDLKSVVRATVPRVRISPSPPRRSRATWLRQANTDPPCTAQCRAPPDNKRRSHGSYSETRKTTQKGGFMRGDLLSYLRGINTNPSPIFQMPFSRKAGILWRRAALRSETADLFCCFV